MAINPALTSQFSQDGLTSAAQISLDYACKSCHTPGGDTALPDDTLVQMATGYHAAP